MDMDIGKNCSKPGSEDLRSHASGECPASDYPSFSQQWLEKAIDGNGSCIVSQQLILIEYRISSVKETSTLMHLMH